MRKTSPSRGSATRECKLRGCRTTFIPKRVTQVFCSPSCKTRHTLSAYEEGLRVIESKGMHAARLSKSERLQRFIEALRSGPKTTRELIETTGLCAINSIAAECRANGVGIDCTYKGTTENGARVYEYRLKGVCTR